MTNLGFKTNSFLKLFKFYLDGRIFEHLLTFYEQLSYYIMKQNLEILFHNYENFVKLLMHS